jgi:nitronate monooxygenase
MWPDRRLLDLFGIEHPIVLAPMAGPGTPELAIAVAMSGGLGSLPRAMSSDKQIRHDLSLIRQRTDRPINLNFFAHEQPQANPNDQERWKRRLAPYYTEFGIDPDKPFQAVSRPRFDEAACEIIEAFRPEVVSFHFGLPEPALLVRVMAAGAKVIASATTVTEAKSLEDRGCDAIIAQGYEAGGHRGMFLTTDVTSQVGTLALVPQIVDRVSVPVIAAGGIADGRGIAAALALGAAGVQIGTAFLFCPEARVSPLYKAALMRAREDGTALTNLFTGRPARAIINRFMREGDPISTDPPQFPLAIDALSPLRSVAEARGCDDFTPLWSGQSASLGVAMPAGDLMRKLAESAQVQLSSLSSTPKHK